MTKFSVTICTTNRAETIQDALISVRNQTYQNYEVILMDFGSTDGTQEIIKNFILKYKLSWTYVENRFTPKGCEDWNYPLRVASGKYAAILEGDDIWPVDYLLKANEAIDSDPRATLLFSGQHNEKKYLDLESSTIEGKDALLRFYRLKSLHAPSQSIFRLFKGSGDYFKTEEYKYCPEIDLWTECAERGNIVFLSNNCVYRGISKKSIIEKVQFEDQFKFLKSNERKEKTKNALFFFVKIKLLSFYFLRISWRIIRGKNIEKNALINLFSVFFKYI